MSDKCSTKECKCTTEYKFIHIHHKPTGILDNLSDTQQSNVTTFLTIVYLGSAFLMWYFIWKLLSMVDINNWPNRC